MAREGVLGLFLDQERTNMGDAIKSDLCLGVSPLGTIERCTPN